MLITTKPNIVKYSTIGIVTLEGSAADIKKKLEANPKTKIPQILFTVYQHIFNSIYILASILNTPYPPPDLLHPMAEKIQILPSAPQAPPKPETTAAPQQLTTEQPATPETPATETTTTVAEDKTGTTTEQLANRQPSTSETAGQTSASAASGKAQTKTTPP